MNRRAWSVLLVLGNACNLSAITVANDNVFGDNTSAQIAAMTPTLSGSLAVGYTGAITTGVPA